MHPGWEYHLWREDNLPPIFNQKNYDLATSYPMRADILRVELLYTFGGIYLDADSLCLRSLQPLLSSPFVVQVREDHGSPVVANGVIGMPPKHPCMTYLLHEFAGSLDLSLPAWQITGTLPMTRAIHLYPTSVQILPTESFFPYSSREIRLKSPPEKDLSNSYAIQYWASTNRTYKRYT